MISALRYPAVLAILMCDGGGGGGGGTRSDSHCAESLNSPRVDNKVQWMNWLHYFLPPSSHQLELCPAYNPMRDSLPRPLSSCPPPPPPPPPPQSLSPHSAIKLVPLSQGVWPKRKEGRKEGLIAKFAWPGHLPGKAESGHCFAAA